MPKSVVLFPTVVFFFLPLSVLTEPVVLTVQVQT